MRNDLLEDIQNILEISDPFIIECMIIFVEEKLVFLQRKLNWCKNEKNNYEILYEPLINILSHFLNILESVLEFKKTSTFGEKIIENFKKIYNEKNLNYEFLSQKSYFTSEQLINILEGNSMVYDNADLEHLMQLVECLDIEEMIG